VTKTRPSAGLATEKSTPSNGNLVRLQVDCHLSEWTVFDVESSSVYGKLPCRECANGDLNHVAFVDLDLQ
jgi:hypothetical protein